MQGISPGETEGGAAQDNGNETDGWRLILGDALGMGTAWEGGRGGVRLKGECLEGLDFQTHWGYVKLRC